MHVLVLTHYLPAAAALCRILKAAGFVPALLTHAYLEGHAPSWPHSATGPDGPSRPTDALAAPTGACPSNFGNAPAAIVLDCDRPTVNGECPVQQLRALGHRLPILVLAANHSPAAEAQYFENGANDYIAKPYAVPVLVARLRALVHRSASGSWTGVSPVTNGAYDSPVTPAVLSLLRVADLRLNLLTREARRGHRAIELTAREFVLLRLLMERRGELCSREDILQAWNNQGRIDTKIVAENIRRLRAKVTASSETQLIHSVYGEGYKLTEEP